MNILDKMEDYDRLQQENADLRAQLAEERHYREVNAKAYMECADKLAAATKRIEEAEKQEPNCYMNDVGNTEAVYKGGQSHGFVIPLYTRPIPPADVEELQDKLNKSTALIQEIAGIAFEHIRPNETTLGLPHLLCSQFGRIAEIERKLAEQKEELDTCGEQIYDSISKGECRKHVAQAREEGRKEAVPEWMPIETAPKDGSWIIATSTHNKYFRVAVQFQYGNWLDVNETNQDCLMLDAATHWMPLPADPSPASLKEGGE